MAELENAFAWSWSRHEMFYRCPRQLYWQYYGSWGGWKDTAPHDASLAYRLKQIKSVAMLVGDVFHQVLRERLLMRTKPNEGVPASQMADEGERRMLKAMRESRDRNWQREGPKKSAILFEDYYGPGVSESEQRVSIEKLRECVGGLAESTYGRRAFDVPPQRLRIVDPDIAGDIENLRFSVDGLTVYGAPDLVVEDRHARLHIIDWKTGKPDKAKAAQLAVYGMYVSDKLGAPPDSLTAHLVYVSGAPPQLLQNLREPIAEARKMFATYTADVQSRLTDVAANVAGDIDQFPMTENRTLCRSCKFRELCGRLEQVARPPDDADEDE